MLKLDARLQAAADLVLPGLPLADIGTDHAYLPLYLVKAGICPRAVASDKAISSIRAAIDLISAQDVSGRISPRCGDGLSVLEPGEVATIVLCGMGGLLMSDILQKGMRVLQKTRRLVLQPQSHIEAVRWWLAAHGWRIIEEKIVENKGFFYVLLAAEPGKMVLTELEAEFGPYLLCKRDPVFRAWLERKIQEREAVCHMLEKQDGQRTVQRCSELRMEIQRIQELIG